MGVSEDAEMADSALTYFTVLLQTAAMVLIAKTANPDLFADVDADNMLQMLAEEATGTLPAGTYYYKEE